MAETLDHTNAVIALLRARVGRPVGDAQAPRNYTYPYCVVYRHDTFDFHMSGPLSDGQADKSIYYQIVSVGQNREQAEALAERVRTAMRSGDLNVPGYSIQDVQIDLLGRTLRDDDIRPPVFTSMDRFRVMSTPLSTP